MFMEYNLLSRCLDCAMYTTKIKTGAKKNGGLTPLSKIILRMLIE
jgi:hypothetical protein